MMAARTCLSSFIPESGHGSDTDTDKSDDAGCLQDVEVLLCVCFQTDERVAVKEHTLDCFLPIAPIDASAGREEETS